MNKVINGLNSLRNKLSNPSENEAVNKVDYAKISLIFLLLLSLFFAIYGIKSMVSDAKNIDSDKVLHRVQNYINAYDANTDNSAELLNDIKNEISIIEYNDLALSFIFIVFASILCFASILFFVYYNNNKLKIDLLQSAAIAAQENVEIEVQEKVKFLVSEYIEQINNSNTENEQNILESLALIKQRETAIMGKSNMLKLKEQVLDKHSIAVYTNIDLFLDRTILVKEFSDMEKYPYSFFQLNGNTLLMGKALFSPKLELTDSTDAGIIERYTQVKYELLVMQEIDINLLKNEVVQSMLLGSIRLDTALELANNATK